MATTEEHRREFYDEAFQFLIGWYALAVVWIFVWHEPAAQAWLGVLAGARVSPLLPPLVLAYALTSISIISSSQLGALNKVGTQAIFHLISGLLTLPAVYLGWKWGGLYGLALGFLVSRVPLFFQDISSVRLIGAGGWLSRETWLLFAAQGAIGGLFFLLRNIIAASLFTSLLLALLHAAGVGAWLVWKLVPGSYGAGT